LDNEEKLKEIPKPESKEYELASVENVNFNPHPYVIGTRLLAFTTDNYNGRLGEAAILDAEKKRDWV